MDSKGWIECKLGEACDVGDGAHAKVERQREGIPYLTSRNIGRGSLKLDDVDYISAEDFERLFPRTSKAVRRAQPGDVLMGIIGTFGNLYRFRDTDTFGVSSSIALLRPKKDLLDPDFLYYLVSSPMFQEAHSSFKSGSAQGYTNIPTIKAIPICFPPISHQQAVATVLASLDDKIELNRRMNETLEALAQSLFKSWFVDAIHSAIPKGWEVHGLDEIANFLNGLALQKFPPNGDDSLPVIKIAQLRAGHTEGADRAGTNLAPQYIIENGDVLFSWSGSLLVDIWCGGRGALNQHLFKVTSDQFPKWFYYLWTRYHLAGFQNTAADKATTMGHIQRHHLREAKVFVPPTAELDKIDRQISPLVEKLIANNLESRTLAALRDAMLPKLLSGELRVPQA